MKNLPLRIICLALLICNCAGICSAQSAQTGKDHRFEVDAPNVIGRSDIVLGRPNLEASEAMPLGNGRLGVAVWSGEGFTAQLNRNDTLPDRLSPGQVVIPGLGALTRANDYSGRLDLFHGEFREQVEAMIQWCHRGPSGASVTDVAVDHEEPADEFTDFGIR